MRQAWQKLEDAFAAAQKQANAVADALGSILFTALFLNFLVFPLIFLWPPLLIAYAVWVSYHVLWWIHHYSCPSCHVPLGLRFAARSIASQSTSRFQESGMTTGGRSQPTGTTRTRQITTYTYRCDYTCRICQAQGEKTLVSHYKYTTGEPIPGYGFVGNLKFVGKLLVFLAFNAYFAWALGFALLVLPAHVAPMPEGFALGMSPFIRLATFIYDLFF